jgi:peptidase M13-like protein
VNFGGIGFVIGHELTHGFDDAGSKFDERGNVREWQTPDDRKDFAETASCEVAEHSQFGAMPDADDLPQLKVNGNLTLAEKYDISMTDRYRRPKQDVVTGIYFDLFLGSHVRVLDPAVAQAQ